MKNLISCCKLDKYLYGSSLHQLPWWQIVNVGKRYTVHSLSVTDAFLNTKNCTHHLRRKNFRKLIKIKLSFDCVQVFSCNSPWEEDKYTIT